MNLTTVLLSLIGVGAGAGLVNALMTDNSFALPVITRIDSRVVIQPGIVGNAIVSAFAAVLSWALYASDAQLSNLLTQPSEQADIVGFVRTLGGAALVGLAGARWLTSEVDKKLRAATRETVARVQGDPELVQSILGSSPREGLRLAREAVEKSRTPRVP